MPGILRFTHMLIAVWILVSATTCLSQPTRLQVIAGSGISFVTARGINATYTPAILPRIAIRCAFPINTHVAFLTGLSYERKGFNSRSELRSDIDDDLDVIQGRTRYNLLSIPLQVSVQLRQRHHYALWLGGGMSYGFMMRAQTDWDMYSYRHGQLINHNVYFSRPLIALFSSQTRTISGTPVKYGSLYLFNPAIAMSLTLAWHRRYILQTFYEYYLYDASSEASSGSMRLHSAGLMAGIGL